MVTALPRLKALSLNSSIVRLDNDGNRVTPYIEALPQAEVEAMRHISSLRTAPLSADANRFNAKVYSAVARKLRFMTPEQLRALHANPSFNIPATEMKDSLHVLEPPGRVRLIGKIKDSSGSMEDRLVASRALNRRMAASRVIFNVTLRWMREWQQERAFEKAMEALRRAKEKQDLME